MSEHVQVSKPKKKATTNLTPKCLHQTQTPSSGQFLQMQAAKRAIFQLFTDNASFIQRIEASSEKEDPVQMQPENHTGMPDGLKAGVESLSGLDMSEVRVRYNSNRPAKLGALAYTQGTDIHVAPGQERHLPHEAWHAVQQAQGRVQPTMQLQALGGVGVNDEAGLEHEADVMGGRALGGESKKTNWDREPVRLSPGKDQPLQMVIDVFNKQHFTNPKAYLKGTDNKVTEDGGSTGILGAPAQALIVKLADDNTRGEILNTFDKLMNQLLKNNKPIPDYISSFYTEINKINDRKSAALFIRQNSLALSKLNSAQRAHLGIPMEIVHNSGNSNAADYQEHTFHKDAGLITVDANKLPGNKNMKTLKAVALNGPWGTGFVKGHNSINNLKHRFIEHIHVNKEQSEEKRIDIYNASNKSAGDIANAWKGKLDGIAIEGRDDQVVNEAIKAKDDSDLAAI